MNSSLLSTNTDTQRLREFLKALSHAPNVGDLEEQIQIPDIRSTMRLWKQADAITAFAYVDGGNNLRFEIAPGQRTDQMEHEILDWGVECVRLRNARKGEIRTLDASCQADDKETLDFLGKYGFQPESIRTLHYSRSLASPVDDFPLPSGFLLRSAAGEDEVKALVALHRAAFRSEYMTVEERLAIMHAPNYIPELDLVVSSLDGELCAFCICSFEEEDKHTWTTDPIGVHPKYQGMGIGKAILSSGLDRIQQRGAVTAKLGTSSENIPMQKLALRTGFVCVSENLWFSKEVS